MSYAFPPELGQLVQEQMASGRYTSEDALLVDALHALQQSDQETLAIEAALAAVDRGEEGVELDEAFSRLRQRHQIQG